MAEFPASPIPPKEFVEKWFPQAFAEAGLPPGSEQVDVKLGIQLDGEGGGEWIFHLVGGKMNVRQESRTDASFTYVQSVEDWRGALWEGRGGVIGKQASALFRRR